MIGVKLRDIHIENFIWVIYLFISAAALLSNYYESDYIKTNNKKDYQTYKQINITIFVVAFFIYIYFLYKNYKNVTELKKTISNNKKVLYAELNLIAAILFLVGGAIYLYTESNNIESEIGI